MNRVATRTLSSLRLRLARTDAAQRSVNLILLSILILGAGLRFYGLANQSLWNDELSSWSRSQYATLTEVMERGVAFNHPPGFVTFLYFWQRHVGDSEVLLRLPAAAAGFLTIYGIFLLGRRLYSEKEGLIAAALTAVAWVTVYYSQEARSNGIMLLLVVLTSNWLVDIARSLRIGKEPAVSVVFAYIVASILSAYLHYFGLFFVGLQGFFALLWLLPYRTAWLKMLFLELLIAWAYLPWLPSLLRALEVGTPWLKRPSTSAFHDFLLFLFNQSDGLLMLVLALYAALFARQVWALLRAPSRREIWSHLWSVDLFLLAWVLIPFLIVYIKSTLSTPVLLNRNLIILLPGAYLLLARAITQLPYSRISLPFVAVCLITTLLLNLLFVKDYYSLPTKEQFREAVALIVDHESGPEGEVKILGYTWHASYFDYYFERLGSDLRVDLEAGETADIPQTKAMLELEKPTHVWFIAAHLTPDAPFLQFLESEMTLLLHRSFIRADVWLFERK